MLYSLAPMQLSINCIDKLIRFHNLGIPIPSNSLRSRLANSLCWLSAVRSTTSYISNFNAVIRIWRQHYGELRLCIAWLNLGSNDELIMAAWAPEKPVYVAINSRST